MATLNFIFLFSEISSAPISSLSDFLNLWLLSILVWMCLARALLFPAYSFKFFVLFFQLNSFFIQDIIDWFFLFYPIDQQMVFTNKWQISGFLYIFPVIWVISLFIQNNIDYFFCLTPTTNRWSTNLWCYFRVIYLSCHQLFETNASWWRWAYFIQKLSTFQSVNRWRCVVECLNFNWWKINRRSSLDSLCFIYLGFLGV